MGWSPLVTWNSRPLRSPTKTGSRDEPDLDAVVADVAFLVGQRGPRRDRRGAGRRDRHSRVAGRRSGRVGVGRCIGSSLLSGGRRRGARVARPAARTSSTRAVAMAGSGDDAAERDRRRAGRGTARGARTAATSAQPGAGRRAARPRSRGAPDPRGDAGPRGRRSASGRARRSAAAARLTRAMTGMRERVLRPDQRAEADEMTVTGHVLDVLLDREGDADEPGQREPQPDELADVAGGVAAGHGLGRAATAGDDRRPARPRRAARDGRPYAARGSSRRRSRRPRRPASRRRGRPAASPGRTRHRCRARRRRPHRGRARPTRWRGARSGSAPGARADRGRRREDHPDDHTAGSVPVARPRSGPGRRTPGPHRPSPAARAARWAATNRSAYLTSGGSVSTWA